MDLQSLKQKLAALEEAKKSTEPIAHTDYSAAYKRREDGSFVNPGVDDDDYQYDSSSYGVVVKRVPTPDLAPNFETLVQNQDKEGLLGENNKIEERMMKLPPLDVLQWTFEKLTSQVDMDLGRLKKILRRCRVSTNVHLHFAVGYPNDEDCRVLDRPLAWKRAEDKRSSYQPHRECLDLYYLLQRKRFEYGVRAALQENIAKLRKFHHRLEHDIIESLSLVDRIEKVSEHVRVVLNEAERSVQEEDGVYGLAKAAAIDEATAKLSRPPSTRLSRKSGENFPSVLDIPKRGKLPFFPMVDALRDRLLSIQQVESGDIPPGVLPSELPPALFADLAEADFEWTKLELAANETRQVIREVNASREERRAAAEEHYCRVRDQSTASSLEIAAMYRSACVIHEL